MPKNKVKQNKKKPGKQVANRKGRTVAPMRFMGNEIARALVDAFAPGAENAKWPDGTGHSTMTAQLVTRVSLGSDANGYAGIQLQWLPDVLYRKYSSISGDVITYGSNTASQGYTALAANASLFRVTSAACRWRSTQPSTSDQGIAYVADKLYVSDTGASSYAAVFDGVDHEFPVREPFTVPCQLLGSTARGFRVPSTADYTTAASTIIFIGGLPASTVAIGELEIILNVEYLPILTSANSILKQYTAIQPANAQIVDQAKNAMTRLKPAPSLLWRQAVDVALAGASALAGNPVGAITAGVKGVNLAMRAFPKLQQYAGVAESSFNMANRLLNRSSSV